MTVRELLQEVAEFDWSEVEHAYGPATDVPELFRALAEENKNARDKAWYELHGNLWHHGTIYPATARAVPYFIRLLPLLPPAEQVRVLVYLARLYNGQGYWVVHQSLIEVPQQPADVSDQIRREEQVIAVTRKGIADGTQIYHQMLDAEHPGPRIAAAYLLGLLRLEWFEEETVVEEIERSASD